jgi:glycosyltransferase involved in cell wall biosynthesis
VIAQTYRPIECIIVDDGSTDNTQEIVNEQIKRNSIAFTVKYIYQQNAGSQFARNTGTAAATGEFIQYLDSDDILYPDKIQQQVNYLLQHKECDGVFGDWQIGSVEKNETVVAYMDEDLISQLLTKRCIAIFSFLMRRNIVEKIGDWDINIKRNQEIDFQLRGVIAGGKFDYQPGISGLWRQHDAERIANKANLFQAIQFYQKWEKALSEKELLSNEIRSGLAGNYMWFLGEYSGSGYKEMVAILRELYRLTPVNPIFLSFKFRLFKKLCGFRIAATVWLYRYKKLSLKKSLTR